MIAFQPWMCLGGTMRIQEKLIEKGKYRLKKISCIFWLVSYTYTMWVLDWRTSLSTLFLQKEDVPFELELIEVIIGISMPLLAYK